MKDEVALYQLFPPHSRKRIAQESRIKMAVCTWYLRCSIAAPNPPDLVRLPSPMSTAPGFNPAVCSPGRHGRNAFPGDPGLVPGAHEQHAGDQPSGAPRPGHPAAGHPGTPGQVSPAARATPAVNRGNSSENAGACSTMSWLDNN